MGWDSAVSITTRFELDGRGSNPGKGRDFPQPSRTALGPPSLLYNGYRVCFPEVRRPGYEADNSPLPSAEVKSEKPSREANTS